MKTYRKEMIRSQISHFIQKTLTYDLSINERFFYNLEKKVSVITISKVLINEKGTVIDIYYITENIDLAKDYIGYTKPILLRKMYKNLNMRRMPYIRFIHDEKYSQIVETIIRGAHTETSDSTNI